MMAPSLGLFFFYAAATRTNAMITTSTTLKALRAAVLLLTALACNACSPAGPTLVTYQKKQVSFVHFSDWKVTNDAIIEEVTQSRTIDLEGPNDALVSVVLLPSSTDQKLDDFAASIAQDRGSAIKEALSIGSLSAAKVSPSSSQATSADIGGQQLSGIQQRYSIKLLGQDVAHEAAFFLVRGKQMTAIITTQVATEHAKQTAPAFSATLRSFRLGNVD